MGFWSLLQGVLWIIWVLVVGILAITIVGCCLGPLVYVAVIVMDCMSSVVFWVWERVIPDDRGGFSHRRAQKPPPPPVWIDKEASDE